MCGIRSSQPVVAHMINGPLLLFACTSTRFPVLFLHIIQIAILPPTKAKKPTAPPTIGPIYRDPIERFSEEKNTHITVRLIGNLSIEDDDGNESVTKR